jgi:hypothetical protein
VGTSVQNCEAKQNKKYFGFKQTLLPLALFMIIGFHAKIQLFVNSTKEVCEGIL